jgi:hypothetical protein
MGNSGINGSNNNSNNAIVNSFQTPGAAPQPIIGATDSEEEAEEVANNNVVHEEVDPTAVDRLAEVMRKSKALPVRKTTVAVTPKFATKRFV